MVLSQIALNGFLMMAMSPISWSHHNIWLPLLIAAFWLDAFPTFFALAPLVAGHGYVSQVTVDGKTYQGNPPGSNSGTPLVPQLLWAIPSHSGSVV